MDSSTSIDACPAGDNPKDSLEQTESSNESKLLPNNVITEEMIKEEERLEKNAIKEEEEMKQKMLQEEKEMMEEQCYKRLKLLLGRSSIYAQFMADKLNRKNAKLKKKSKRNDPDNSGKRKKTIDSPVKTRRKRMRVDVVDLFEKEKTNLENVDNSPSLDKPKGSNQLQPDLFCGGTMRSYQMEGYEWLKVLYENGVNGILGDEMGLGKTIQCIAFIAHLIEMGVSGPFFVCGPLSTVPNWCAEFKRFAPDIPVVLYHGHRDVRHSLCSKIRKKYPVGNKFSYPVIVTSFQISLIDRKKLYAFDWKLLIIDEAHRIKNYQCRLVKELKLFNATHRLLLTGTPLQNNLSELWSLLNFILPEIFDDLQIFESWFDVTRLTASGAAQEIVAKEQERQIVSTIHQILTPFFLRRTKDDVELELPKKKEVIVHAPLTALQREYYTAVLNKTIEEVARASKKEDSEIVVGKRKRNSNLNYRELNETDFKTTSSATTSWSETYNNSSSLRKDGFSEIYINTRNSQMILRKICCHPYLLSYPLTNSLEYKVDIELVKNSGKFLVLDVMLPALKERGHKVILFSQFTSLIAILEDYCSFRNYPYNLLTGSMSLEERDLNITDFNTNPDSFLFLVSTRAGGLGINLTSADTVIVFDSDWNPQADLQAQDRCHRIGQTKPVVVYRLIVPSTIDERILDRATAKRKLEKAIIQKGRFKSINSLNAQDEKKLSKEELLELLEAADVDGFVKTDESSVISPKQLEELLDRSDMM
ncbi:lymphocyte-specific helicase-like [Uloborus diversus]|uniref:lymphocyte-specific helicase-like n=1 Tax=Uloborus diversus TaxID=327109 RepID=UPI00240A42D8|nr:lymphocyte-specific helicase-like [Uloborus diversus]